MSGPRPRVAIVRLRSLGDVALASAVVEALHGEADLAFVTRRPFATLYDSDPRLETLIALDPDAPLEAARALETFAPEWVLDLQGTLRSRQLVRSLGAPVLRVNKASVRRRLAVIGLRTLGTRRVFERYLEPLSQIVPGGADATPRLLVPAASRDRATREMPGEGVGIGLVPGAAWANKRWPLERWTALAGAVLGDDVSAHVWVVVSESEQALASAILQGIDARSRTRAHVVQVPLGDLPAHLQRLDVLVSGDSGPMHVAEAVGTPVIALFGPTVPAFGFAPFRSDSRIVERRLMCRPCHVHGGDRCPLGHHRCMRDIAVSDIIEEVRGAVERRLSHAEAPPVSSEGG